MALILARQGPDGEAPATWAGLRRSSAGRTRCTPAPEPSGSATAAADPARGEVGAALRDLARRCRTPRPGSRGPAGPRRRASTASWHPPSKTRQSASSQPPHGGSQSVSSSGPGVRASPSSSSTSRPTAQLRRLADLDDAAGQVPVLLVGELAQQHPVVGVADQQLADRPLAGQEGVEQGPEPARLVDGGVGREPRVDDPVGRRRRPAARASRPRGASRPRWRPAARRRRRGRPGSPPGRARPAPPRPPAPPAAPPPAARAGSPPRPS